MSKTRILVVEDESIVAKDIQRTLEKLGYDVPATASSAASAYEKLEEVEPDLVFLDVKLKENTLYESLKGYNGSTNGIKYKESNQRLFLIHKNGEKTKHRFIIYNIITHEILISNEFAFFKNTTKT
jgi:PleD family two-component response regulator